MEQNQLDKETFSCSICLDLLKDPVAIPCGHSYCMNCIKRHWNEENQRRIHSCPQCRETFTQRPILKRNTMLAALVEQLKKNGPQAAPADHCYAGPEDVACDFCTGRKLKAITSCLVCLASYCEKHLQPHYHVAPLKKHKLGKPSKNLQENICSHHYEVMKMFCRTDQKCICYLCSVEEHKGHDTVSAEAEMAERQSELEERRGRIQQGIQDREKDVVLKSRPHSLNRYMLEFGSVKNNQFLHSYPSLSALSESTHSSSINIRPLRHFEDVTAAVSELRDKLQDILRDTWTNISLTITEVDVLLSEPEPKSRAGFLKYFCKITLDPNTAHTQLLLSEGNRKVTAMKQHQSYSSHPERFTDWWQVLSRESLNRRCYWEVEGKGGVRVAIVYKNISRAGNGNECKFGWNEKSWALDVSQDGYKFGHNNMWTSISGPVTSRIGVYLDHSAGILSFHSVSKTMTLLHRVQTTFTQPLHAGLWVYWTGNSAEICKPK
ncbi:PREDICTED: E3 ubiquitin/ISG15 ligase TRIM25-like [Cyprinodon variegatus]|uniref:E3 ubiquitin/ISG15 ligase TRIM25-like n=1 Tax=Cyprinodon variegatus TaxID=28743 RepID=UPI0007427944|nr:PREDICTED: E3 ubiquitin/ISG15 ligase TRIM25-like [Cyprinodon variegatus]